MKALIAYYSKSGKTKAIAEQIAAGLKECNCNVTVSELFFEKKKTKTKNPEPELMPVEKDLSKFDIVIIGSPVFGLNPKRKISKQTEAFIRECTGLEGKNVFVFLVCFGMPGTSMKKICGMIQSRGATVKADLVTTYLLGLNQKQLEEAKFFGKKIFEPEKN